MSEFYMIFARKMPEFYIMIARKAPKIFFPIFFLGGGHMPRLPPVSYAYGVAYKYIKANLK